MAHALALPWCRTLARGSARPRPSPRPRRRWCGPEPPRPLPGRRPPTLALRGPRPPRGAVRRRPSHRCLATAPTSGKGEEDAAGGGVEDVALASIHLHLEELETIALADVRNFCIIAHVVSGGLLDELGFRGRRGANSNSEQLEGDRAEASVDDAGRGPPPAAVRNSPLFSLQLPRTAPLPTLAFGRRLRLAFCTLDAESEPACHARKRSGVATGVRRNP